MNTDEIAFAIHKTPRLVKEYEKIIDEYAEKSYVLDSILSFQPHIESNTEVWANEYEGNSAKKRCEFAEGLKHV